MGEFEDIAELETNLAVEELGFRAPRIIKALSENAAQKSAAPPA